MDPTTLAQSVAGRDPVSWLDVLRHDAIPVGSAFLVFVGMLVAFHRGRDRAPGPSAPAAARSPRPAWPHLVRYLAGTVAGGYAVFLAIVVVFYLILGGEEASFVTDAVAGGSFLAFVLVPAGFLAISWLSERRPPTRSP
jgi:hypothetical protein